MILHVLDPWVIVGISRGESLADILDKKLGDEVLSLRGDTSESLVLKGILTAQHVLNDFLVALSWERHLSREEDIEDDTH